MGGANDTSAETRSHPAGRNLEPINLAAEAPVRLGALTVRPALRQVVHGDGRDEILQPRVMQVLVALLRADGEILTRDDLVASCWRGVVVGEDAITRVIGSLRRLSEGIGAGAFKLETITRVGYRLVHGDLTADVGPPAGAPVAGPPAPLLAVLAFDNLCEGDDMDWFSDGVSEEIQQTVARATDLKVIGRTSSFRYRGADKDPRRVSAELKATHLLDGAIRHSGGRVRISAQLIECDGETTLWSDRFERDLTDVFALQDEIAAAVAAALKVVLRPGPKAEPVDPAAYELLLKARNLKSGNFTDPTGIVAAISLLERATGLAPRFARAWANLAAARLDLLRRHGTDRPHAVARAEVVAAAERALELDPSLENVHPVLAELEPVGRWSEREAALGKALAVAPNDADVLSDAATFCAKVGRHREGLGLARRAFELDPMNLRAANYYGCLLVATGRYSESRAIYDRLIAEWPDATDMLANAIAHTAYGRDWDRRERLIARAKARGMYEGYLRDVAGFARRLQTSDPTYVATFLQYARDELAQTGNVREDTLACMCELDLNDEAFTLLERSSFDYVTDPEKPWPGVPRAWQIFSRHMRWNLIRDPRFPRLCAKLRLCDYWVETGKWPDCADEVSYDFRAEARRLAGAAQRTSEKFA